MLEAHGAAMRHFGGQRYSRACAELRMSRYAFLNPAFPRPTEGDAERESGTAGINCKKICSHLSSRTPSQRCAVFGQGCMPWMAGVPRVYVDGTRGAELHATAKKRLPGT